MADAPEAQTAPRRHGHAWPAQPQCSTLDDASTSARIDCRKCRQRTMRSTEQGDRPVHGSLTARVPPGTEAAPLHGQSPSHGQGPAASVPFAYDAPARQMPEAWPAADVTAAAVNAYLDESREHARSTADVSPAGRSTTFDGTDLRQPAGIGLTLLDDPSADRSADGHPAHAWRCPAHRQT